MASIGGANIVTDGLIVNLDSANKNSYPGSGTFLFDLTSNNNSGSLLNGPTFNSQNYGSFLFDGTDDYVATRIFTPNFTDKTLTAWCKLTSVSQTGGGLIGVIGNTGEPFDTITYNEIGTGWGFGSNAYQRTVWSGVKETSTADWVQMTATYQNSNYNLYRNGSLILNTTSFSALNYNFTSSIYLGRRHTVGPLGAYIANGLVYNRSLSAAEVLQNYNAQKSRFGL